MALVGPGLSNFLDYAELFKKGLPPVSGGTLDQAQWFIGACRFLWSQQHHWEAKLGIPGGT